MQIFHLCKSQSSGVGSQKQIGTMQLYTFLTWSRIPKIALNCTGYHYQNWALMHPIHNFLGANSTCQQRRLTAVKTNYAKLSDLIFLQESSSHSRVQPQFKEVQANEWNARPFILIWECQLSGQWKHPISSYCWDHHHHHQCTINFLFIIILLWK